MKGQYEQQCNAAALQHMGVPVLKSLKEAHVEKIREWTKKSQSIPVQYLDITESIIDQIITEHQLSFIIPVADPIRSVKDLKGIRLQRLNKIPSR